MKNRIKAILATAALICLIPAASFAIDPYFQDFEAMDAADPDILGVDGWLVYGNIFDGTTGDYLYGHGPWSAPNNPTAPAFCNIVVDEGGDDQGVKQMSVFSDYENVDHAAGHTLESIVFREQVIGFTDVGTSWKFEFQAKNGGITGASTATAFIKTLDPTNGYAMTNYIFEDMTSIPADWGGWSLTITIDETLIGQIFQIGFANMATMYEPSAIIYDNVLLQEYDPTPVPDAAAIIGATLGQNYPNPFNPKTRIDFSLDKPGFVDIAVYDLSGRQVARLHNGDLAAGDHFVMWNGLSAGGSPAPAGQYQYVMKTAAGQVSRSMILLK